MAMIGADVEPSTELLLHGNDMSRYASYLTTMSTGTSSKTGNDKSQQVVKLFGPLNNSLSLCSDLLQSSGNDMSPLSDLLYSPLSILGDDKSQCVGINE